MNLADEVYKELLNRLGVKTALVIGEDRIEFENNFLTVEVCENVQFDCIVIRNLDNSMLVNLALGRAGNLKEKLILKAFCENKRVYISKDGVAYLKMKNDIHRKLFKLYENYEKKILEFGAELIGWRRVITEKSVRDYFETGGQCITVGKEIIITPLAMDFIKAHDIRLERR